MSCPEGSYAYYPASSADGENLGYANLLCIDPVELQNQNLGYIVVPTEETAAAELGESLPDFGKDMGAMWLIICGALVFLMQAGFAMLEAGAISSKNSVNILFKNLLDASLGAIFFYIFGYAFAYGDSAGGFIGTSNFALSSEAESGSGWEGWFFQWAFAATAATIVSGSVAERTNLTAYFIYSICITSFIYPVVVHWGWGSGFLSAWGATNGPLFTGTDASNGMIDFAGSGIVHLTGGVAGLVGAIFLGPRKGRFDADGNVLDMPGHSMVLTSMGVFILWFGWFGFNAGSTLCTLTCMALAGKVAANTVIAPAACAVVATFYSKWATKKYDLSLGLNAILAGLVSITAPCSVVEPWAAFVIGVVGAFVYIGSSKLLLKLRIDDPLDASPIHGFCGIWGLLSVGIFATDANVQFAAYPNVNTAIASGEQFGVQLVGALAITAWVAGTSAVVFGVCKALGILRVSEEVEAEGLDSSEHGAKSYIGFDEDEKK